MPRARTPLALLAALALALAGCAPDTGGRMRAPGYAPSAPFATEEEALAAAVEVYDRLTVLGDEIARAGGEGAERLEEVATGEFLRVSVDEFNSYRDRDVRQVGYVTYRDAQLQQYSAGPEAAVVIYICEDVSNVDIVQTNGTSVVSPDRSDTLYLLVVFDVDADGDLRVSSRSRWDDRAC